MKTLLEQIERLMRNAPCRGRVLESVANIKHAPPFCETQSTLSALVERGVLAREDRDGMLSAYAARNPYIGAFAESPRGFGERWVWEHIRGFCPSLVRSTAKSDPACRGRYDCLLDGSIRVELKSARMTASSGGGTTVERALAIDSDDPYFANFQQVKPALCDAFLLVAVWTDALRFWVLSPREVLEHPAYSASQHRGSSGEGQLRMTPANAGQFGTFAVSPSGIEAALRSCPRR